MSVLQPLGPEIWTVEGPASIDLLVVPYPTRMTIVRLDGGDLWISSTVSVPKQQLDDVAALGPVRHLLAPTPRHRWRLEPWSALFPEASLWSCALGPATLGRRSMPARRLDTCPPPEWAGQIEHAVFRGAGFEELSFFHRPSRTLIVEDVLQCHRLRAGARLSNAAIRLGGIAHPGGMPRDIKALAWRSTAARRWAETIQAWDVETLVMAHGPVLHGSEARTFIERALRQWGRPSRA